jgi:integrase
VLVYLARLPDSDSQRAMLGCLDRIAHLLMDGAIPPRSKKFRSLSVAWGEMRYEHSAAIRAFLLRHYEKASTINSHLAALRGVLKEAWRLGYLPAEDYHRAADLESIEETDLPAGRELTQEEIAALLRVCYADPLPAGARDGAMIACLCVGLRRSEVVKLDLDDYTPDNGGLAVRQSKRRKSRTLYLPPNGRAYLRRWLQVRGLADGALFVPVYGDVVRVDKGHMTPQAVYDILLHPIYGRAEEAGIKDFTIHDFRRTFVGNMLEIADPGLVGKVAGMTLKTVQRYDRRGEAAKRDAMSSFFIPPPGE